MMLSRTDTLETHPNMATFQNGGRTQATANTVTAMKRSAERRQCPNCGRKSALVSDVEWRQTVCRWGVEGKCDYVRLWDTHPQGETETSNE